MQILPFHFSRSPAVAGVFCLVLATVVAGCASKNPLMEEPAPVASKKKIVPVQKAESAPAPAEVATTPAQETQQAAPVAAAKAQDIPVAPAATETAAADLATPVAAPAPAEKAPAVTPTASAATAAATTGVQTKREKRFLGFFRPYRPDVQQGNFVSQEMVAQLKTGMTQDQVIFLLGSPLLNDLFHAERWDYAFRLQKGNGEVTTSRVTVFFKDNVVSHFEGGGDLPTEADYLARIANKAKEAKDTKKK